ncbi:MAG: methyltransferase [Pedosphaera sp.]|nr:methyltransferase [Pedosphaera sp.]
MAAETHLEFYRRWHRLSKPYIRWQFEQFQPFIGRRVADVGCGLGNFTELLADRDFYLGIDLDEELLAELRRVHGHRSNVETARLDITKPELKESLRAKGVDTVLCVNVVEHVADDAFAVCNMIAAIPSGGHVCLLMPALPFLFGTLDELDGHYRRYTKQIMAKLFDGQPGKILKLYYFNLIGVPGWFIKGRVLKQRQHTNDNYAIMNALLPVVRPLERLIAPPLGMSVICVFRKN